MALSVYVRISNNPLTFKSMKSAKKLLNSHMKCVREKTNKQEDC